MRRSVTSFLTIVLTFGLVSLVLPKLAHADTLFTDQFNGSGELSQYNTSYSNYCFRFGANGSCPTLSVDTDHVQQTYAIDSGIGYLYTGISQSNMCASVDFNWSAHGGGWASVIVRGLANGSPREDEFQARSDGSWNYLQDEGAKFDSGPLTLDVTKTHNVKICANGSTVTGYIDNVLYATETDTENSGTYAGLGIQGVSDPSQAETMDNFTITTVVPTTNDISNTIAQMYADGSITKLGTSLNDKLTQAQTYINANDNADAITTLQALINQIQAQIDIHITQDAATILIAQIQALINSLQ